MSKTADAVIIGAGVVGASIAHFLGKTGLRKIVLVDRESRLGLGSTGKATGGIRAQFGSPIEIKMSLYSIDFFSRFQEEVGADAAYKPSGYLFLSTTEQESETLKRNRDTQERAGLHQVEMLSQDDVAKMVPFVQTHDVLGASFCSVDGFLDPLGAMNGFLNSARKQGAELWLNTHLTGIEVNRGRVSKLSTTAGDISTPAVVNAAGAWAAETARLAGIDLPVFPLRRQVVSCVPERALPEDCPMVVEMSSGFHFRPEFDGSAVTGALLVWPDPEEQPGFDTGFEDSFVQKVMQLASQRTDCFENATINRERCRAGLYEMTPDRHAIIGEATEVRGFFLANGFSGHGVMHSPATGKIISDLVVHGKTALADISSLRPGRFIEGDLNASDSVI